MSGFEALLRCERAFGEPIAPGPFVQVAEETGLIVPDRCVDPAWRPATEPHAWARRYVVGVGSVRIRERLGVPARVA